MQEYSFVIFYYQMISFLLNPLRQYEYCIKMYHQTCNEKLLSLSSCLLTALKYFYIVSKQLSFFYHKCQYLLNIYQANNLKSTSHLSPFRACSESIGSDRYFKACAYLSMLFLFPTPGKSLEIGRILLFSLLVPFYSPLPYNIEPLIPPPPYLFWVINLTGRRRFVHLLSARVSRENLHQGSRKSRSLHQLQFIGLSAVSLLFLLSRIFYRPDIILPDCLPFPLLSKKTGAKADRFLLFSKCNRKVWQPCCRLPARAVLRRTPPPRDVRGCRLGQTTWGTLNPG